jgi:putative transcriptional regulator
MKVINNRFGILLAQKRMKEKRRISISEVSERTGINRQSLQAWENNTVSRFDLVIMDALCEYFDCQPGDLFEYIPVPSELELLETARKAKELSKDWLGKPNRPKPPKTEANKAEPPTT